jgi:hypothetical protein
MFTVTKELHIGQELLNSSFCKNAPEALVSKVAAADMNKVVASTSLRRSLLAAVSDTADAACVSVMGTDHLFLVPAQG